MMAYRPQGIIDINVLNWFKKFKKQKGGAVHDSGDQKHN